jgi:hypothetical protein
MSAARCRLPSSEPRVSKISQHLATACATVARAGVGSSSAHPASSSQGLESSGKNMTWRNDGCTLGFDGSTLDWKGALLSAKPGSPATCWERAQRDSSVKAQDFASASRPVSPGRSNTCSSVVAWLKVTAPNLSLRASHSNVYFQRW